MRTRSRCPLTISALAAGVALTVSWPAAAQDLLVGDHGSQCISLYSLKLQSLQLAPHVLPAKVASADTPYDILLDPDNNLLVATGEKGNSVERFDGMTGEWIDTFVVPGSGGLAIPTSMIYGPDKNLYVTSSGNGDILRFNGATGEFIDRFIEHKKGNLGLPGGLVFGRDNKLYVADFGRNAVLRFDGATGEPCGVFASGHGLSHPRCLAFGPDKNLYVSSGFFGPTSSVLRFKGDTGEFMDEFIPNGRGGLNTPGGLAFGTDGRLYVVSEGSHAILCYQARTGAFLGKLGDTASNGYGILYLPKPEAAREAPAASVKGS